MKLSTRITQLEKWLCDLFRVKPKPPPPPIPPLPGPDPTAALLAWHNQARVAKGLTALRHDIRLQAMAIKHATDMAETNTLSHSDPITHEQMGQALADVGYSYKKAAENVAEGQPTASAVVQAWLSDLPHRANVLGPYQDLGAAGAQAKDGTWYWCADYGMPL